MPGSRSLDLPAIVGPAVVTLVGDRITRSLPRIGLPQRVIIAVVLLSLHQALDAPATQFLRRLTH